MNYDISCYPIHYDGGDVKICQKRTSSFPSQTLFETSNCFKHFPCDKDCKCVRRKHKCYYYNYNKCPHIDKINCEFGCRSYRPCTLKYTHMNYVL